MAGPDLIQQALEVSLELSTVVCEDGADVELLRSDTLFVMKFRSENVASLFFSRNVTSLKTRVII